MKGPYKKRTAKAGKDEAGNRNNTFGQFRKDGGDVLRTDPTPGRTYHIYCAFTAADRSQQSDSVYLGAITM